MIQYSCWIPWKRSWAEAVEHNVMVRDKMYFMSSGRRTTYNIIIIIITMGNPMLDSQSANTI